LQVSALHLHEFLLPSGVWWVRRCVIECLHCFQRVVFLYKLIAQFQGNFINEVKMRLLITLLNSPF
jgi:hypothetical protein